MKVQSKIIEWETRFDEEFPLLTYSQFDSVTVEKIKSFITRVRNDALEEAAALISRNLAIENNKYVGDEATGYFACVQDAVATIRSLKK